MVWAEGVRSTRGDLKSVVLGVSGCSMNGDDGKSDMARVICVPESLVALLEVLLGLGDVYGGG